jgi:hypothetical protein
MKIIKPTSEDQEIENQSISVFLAGSIEMGAAEDWQTEIPKYFENEPVTFFNPRRDEWDSSWKQKQSNPQFNHQVNWEMNKLEECDIIFMYFSPETKSPISLLELGLHADDRKMIVCCPDGFWRKGNVEITCTRHHIPMFNTMEEAVGALRTSVVAKKRILNNFY